MSVRALFRRCVRCVRCVCWPVLQRHLFTILFATFAFRCCLFATIRVYVGLSPSTRTHPPTHLHTHLHNYWPWIALSRHKSLTTVTMSSRKPKQSKQRSSVRIWMHNTTQLVNGTPRWPLRNVG